jgi:transposase
MEPEIFVGLDVHKSVVVATAVDQWGNRLNQTRFGSSDSELIDYLRRLPGKTRVALEATTVWEHFHDAAVTAGAEVVLSNPYKTRLIAEASLKSDKVDSEALATLLRLRALPQAFIPNESARSQRRIVRDRLFYRKQEKAIRNHVYSILLAKGIPYEDGLLGLKRRREQLRTHRIPEVDRGIDRLLELEATTRELDRAIHEAFTSSSDAQLLASVPGIGELTAVTIAAYLCPIERFATLDQAASYCGLCPTNHQSASTSFHGALKPDCNPTLRWILVEASWTHRQRESRGYVARVGRRNSRRKGAARGSIAAAHALLRVVFAILKRGTPYTPHAPERPTHAPERPSCKVVPATSD